MAQMSMSNALDLDLDMEMMARALVTPNADLLETPWTGPHPLDSQPPRNEVASRGMRLPKVRPVRRRPREASKPRKSPKRRTRANSIVRTTQFSSNECNTASGENTLLNAVEPVHYEVADVANVVIDAFDEVLSEAVIRNANTLRARFQLHIIKNLLDLGMKRMLEANATRNFALTTITDYVFGSLHRLGIQLE